MKQVRSQDILRWKNPSAWEIQYKRKLENSMQYKTFKDNIKLSRLGMGVMRLPVLDGDDSRIDYEKGQKLIDQCMEQGINYYDTAYIYHGGKSEEFLGKALAKYPRDSFYVTDKYNFQAEPDYKKQFSQQLKRMNMERIDFYLLHGIQDAFADEMVSNGCIAYFDERKRAGQIRYLGFSFHGSAGKLRHLLTMYPWDFVQIQLNYFPISLWARRNSMYMQIWQILIFPLLICQP